LHHIPPPVWLSELRLTHFRNHAQLRLNLGSAPVVLVGPNGAGKTTILEAVSFLSPGRGLRRATLAEVNQTGATHPWAVFARIHGADTGELTLGTGRDPEAAAHGTDKRIVRLNGTDQPGQSALEDLIPQVWLTPRMDRLFQGGASDRRHLLDRMVYGFYPAHLRHARAYEHALRERARLLLQHRPDPVWLTTLEERMAAEAVALAASRRDVVQRLNAHCAGADSPFPRAWFACEGLLEDLLAEQTAVEAEDAYRDQLRQTRHPDTATPGPHRSDLAAWHMDTDTPAEVCSTGEQKALLLRLILANAATLAEVKGRMPVLLLDEVTAHLDAGRRAGLFAVLLALGAQAWLTGTDRVLFEGLLPSASLVQVAGGQIG